MNPGLHQYAIDEYVRKQRRSEAQDRLSLEEQAARGWLSFDARTPDEAPSRIPYGTRLRAACAALFARVSTARG